MSCSAPNGMSRERTASHDCRTNSARPVAGSAPSSAAPKDWPAATRPAWMFFPASSKGIRSGGARRVAERAAHERHEEEHARVVGAAGRVAAGSASACVRSHS